MAERWRELHGSDHWDSLLDPLDVDLRRCLINYGEMIMATYEAFIAERRSPNAGMCRYRRADLFRRVEVSHPGWYAVTRYIYATASADVHGKVLLRPLCRNGRARECNWMGYVAVATDEGAAALGRRDIVVAWRGTQRALEWVADLKLAFASAARVLGAATGPNRRCTAVQYRSKLAEQVLTEIARLMDKYKDEQTSITVVGHSLGATLATLNAVDIAANYYNKSALCTAGSRAPVTAVVFGSPRTGDHDFRDIFHRLPGLRMLRVRNRPDRIPLYPPVGYADVGVELLIDTRRSPFLKPHGNESQSHDLECHLHGVAGWQGEHGEFELVVDRDIALVNKFDDCLTDEHPVPVGWKVHHNKNMVKGPDGRWVLEDHESDYGDGGDSL
ncbi:Phospholipase A1-II 2 [Triticum urartu]|uniref:Phospholipase A1 n=1 Tax=Triticum urartu TaxID=4572 RepID=M7YY98_TRIUA|nr:Phospholipase A1-II 2 [Triticum urartu]